MKWIELMIGLMPMIEGRKMEGSSGTEFPRRLDRTVVPSHYDLHVKVMDTGFCGNVGIRVDISQPVDEIMMNAKELDVVSAGIEIDGRRIDGEVVMGDDEKEYEVVRIRFPSTIPRGEGYIVGEFCGDYNSGLVGFYKSGGESKVYSTHFEPTDARRVFPCFDQPDMKATFSISIDAPSNLVVLSNSPSVPSLRKEYGDRAIEYFTKTSKMSTYLVAFVAGELEYIEDWSKSGVRLRVYGQGKEEASWGRYGLEVAKRCIDYFEEYFGIEYEFPEKGMAKIDMIGIPSFGSGAMENWGLITFRKESLLYSDGKDSVEQKKNVAETVCHELGHMWFGNLVTMEWWDDLWLNEGFATWISFKGMSEIGKEYVDWDVEGEFVLWNVIRGMLEDGLGKSHKIRMEVSDPGEIGEIFDAISYSKGASIIRMVEKYVGESVFMSGIRRYIREHMYGNGNGMSLWKAIGESYGKDISSMVEGWISQAGYPVISVNESGENLVLSQRRYSMLGKSDDSMWIVPVVITWGSGENESIEVGEREVVIPRRSDVYKVNSSYAGFYRVLYEADALRRLEERLESMGDMDRVNMVEDVFGLGFGLYGGIGERLRKIGEYYSDGYCVARSTIEKLMRIRSVFYDDAEIVSAVDRRVLGLVEERIESIDTSVCETSVERISMNKYLLSVGIEVGSASAMKKVSELWRRHVEEGAELGELRWIVYKGVVDDNLEHLIGEYKSGRRPGTRWEVISGFSGIKRKESFAEVVKRLCEFSVEDIGVVIAIICRSGNFRDEMVEYVVSHREELYSMVQKNVMLYNTIVMSLRHVSSDPMVEKVSEFLSGIKHSGSSLSIEKVRDEIEWRRRMRGVRDEILAGLRPSE
ncbi:aminopeptidase N [Encephalitozoon hellem]|nr:aminopeptidase N [Encephalitozoon hellem]